MNEILKIILSGLSTFIIYFLGGLDVALIALLTAIVLDYITGMMKAYVSGKLNSNKGLKGLIKKLAYLCLVALAVIVDRICGDTGLIRTAMMYYFVANELLSVIENCAAMDIMVPDFVKEKLEQLKNGNK